MLVNTLAVLDASCRERAGIDPGDSGLVDLAARGHRIRADSGQFEAGEPGVAARTGAKVASELPVLPASDVLRFPWT